MFPEGTLHPPIALTIATFILTITLTHTLTITMDQQTKEYIQMLQPLRNLALNWDVDIATW